MGFIAQRTAMDDIGPMLFIGFRFLLAAVAILPLAAGELRRSRQRIQTDHRRKFLGLGSVFFLGMALQQVGILGTKVTNAGFLTTLYVVMVPLILLVVLRQRPANYVWPASAGCLLGMYCLCVDDLTSIAWGDAFILAGAVVWAVHVILVGRFAQQIGLPITMTCAQFVICSVLAFVAHGCLWQLEFAELGLEVNVLLGALPEIVYAGVFSGGIAFTLQAVGQKYTTPSIAAILMASESLFAALLSAVILGERLQPAGYLGCVLIFGSIVMVEVLAARRPTFETPAS